MITGKEYCSGWCAGNFRKMNLCLPRFSEVYSFFSWYALEMYGNCWCNMYQLPGDSRGIYVTKYLLLVAGTIQERKEYIFWPLLWLKRLLFGVVTLQYHSSVNWLNCLFKKTIFVILKCSNYLCGLNKGLVQLDAFSLLNRVESGLATYQGNRSWKEYRIIFIPHIEFEFHMLYWSSWLNKLENCIELFYTAWTGSQWLWNTLNLDSWWCQRIDGIRSS